MDSLAGRVAVVTGAASGLGEAMARRFSADGARVVLADVAALDSLAAELDAIAVPTDVSDQDSVDALATEVVQRFGAVDLVCNNAGTIAMGLSWEIPVADWRRVLGVNLMGVVHGIRAFTPHLIRSGGHMVNTASMAGVATMPGIGPYVASKHAVAAVSEVLAHDLAATGAQVGVSVLCPGYVPSRLGLPDGMAAPAVAPGGISAADVADAVVSAVLANRFWVFTHPDSHDAVARRAAAITGGLAPTQL